MFNVNKRNNQFLYDGNILAVIPGAYELTEIAEFKKEEINRNFMLETDKNTMNFLMEIKQGLLNFDIENSIASLPVFRIIV